MSLTIVKKKANYDTQFIEKIIQVFNVRFIKICASREVGVIKIYYIYLLAIINGNLYFFKEKDKPA